MLHCYLPSKFHWTFSGFLAMPFGFSPFLAEFCELNHCRAVASSSLCVYSYVPPAMDTGHVLRSCFRGPNQLSSPHFSSPADLLLHLQTHELSDNLLSNCCLLLCCTAPVPIIGRCHRAERSFCFIFLFFVLLNIKGHAKSLWHPGFSTNEETVLNHQGRISFCESFKRFSLGFSFFWLLWALTLSTQSTCHIPNEQC